MGVLGLMGGLVLRRGVVSGVRCSLLPPAELSEVFDEVRAIPRDRVVEEDNGRRELRNS